MPRESASSARPPARPVDLGWLFLLPGIVLIAAAVLIAAEDDLYAARFRRDEAMAIERRHAERVARYEAYLDAVTRRDPTVVRSLVAGQLNAEPTDMVEAYLPGAMVYDPGEVFASLEPPEAEPARRQRVDSVLARWATDDASRVWLMASGALCVFVGLLPPIGRRAGASDEIEPDGDVAAPWEDDRGEVAEELEEVDGQQDEPEIDGPSDVAEPEAGEPVNDAIDETEEPDEEPDEEPERDGAEVERGDDVDDDGMDGAPLLAEVDADAGDADEDQDEGADIEPVDRPVDRRESVQPPRAGHD